MNSSYLKYVAKIEENMKKAQARLAGLEDYDQGPCQDGYVQIGMKDLDGKEVPNCVPADKSGE
jgi:hypothetical protein